MKMLQLKTEIRDITGCNVKHLRKSGVVPATVYGKTLKSISIQVPLDTFVHIFQQTGETGLINLIVAGDIYPVLVKKVQRDPVSDLPIHVEFHRVDLKEKIRANVPIVILGESPAVKEGVGTLLQLLSEIEVEALPTDLPDRIEVDISRLVNVNDHIIVKELQIPDDAQLLTDPEIMVVKIGELLAPEPEPVPVPVEGEPAEGEVGKEPAAEEEGGGSEEKTDEPVKPEGLQEKK